MKRFLRSSPCPICGNHAPYLSRYEVRDGLICRGCAKLAECLSRGKSVSTADHLPLMQIEEIGGLIRKEKAEHDAVLRAFSSKWTNLFVVTGILSASVPGGQKEKQLVALY